MTKVGSRPCKRSREWNRELARQHLQAQPESGLTVRAYCLAHDLKEWTFYNWRRRVLMEDRIAELEVVGAKPEVPSGPAFAEVVLARPSGLPESPFVEVVLSGERRVRVGVGFDEATFMRVVSLLESLPC